VQELSSCSGCDRPDVVVALVDELADLGQRVAVAVMEDDHDALAVRQLLHEVPKSRVASGLGRGQRREDAIEHASTTVDPIAAGCADPHQPTLDGGRVPQLAESLATDDIRVVDGVFGGLRTEERPSECEEARPEAFERNVETFAVQCYRIRQGAMDGGEPRRIGRHRAGTIR